MLDDLEFVKDGKIIISKVILLERDDELATEYYYDPEETLALINLSGFIIDFYNERLNKIESKVKGNFSIEEEIKGIIMPGTEGYQAAMNLFDAETDRSNSVGVFPAVSPIMLENRAILDIDYCKDCLIQFDETANFHFCFMFLLRNIYLDIFKVKEYLNYFYRYYGQSFLEFSDNHILLYGKFYPNEAFVNLLKKWLVHKSEQTNTNEPSMDTEMFERLDAVPLGYMFLLFADFMKNNPKGEDKTNLIKMLHAIEGSKYSKLENSKFYKVIYKGLEHKNDKEQRKILNKIKVRLEKYDLKPIVNIVENELKQIP